MKRNGSVFGLSIVLFPFVLFAATESSTPKAIWLEQVKSGVTVPICKSFVEDESIVSQMKVRDINYDKCLSLLPLIANQCIQKYDPQIPATITDDMAEKWGHMIGECIGNDFAVTYLYSDEDTNHEDQKLKL